MTMIRITFEGTTEDVMKEMKDFVDNRAKGVVVEIPKNWTTQGVDPDEPKVEAAAPVARFLRRTSLTARRSMLKKARLRMSFAS